MSALANGYLPSGLFTLCSMVPSFMHAYSNGLKVLEVSEHKVILVVIYMDQLWVKIMVYGVLDLLFMEYALW